jgi:hypothetical protein
MNSPIYKLIFLVLIVSINSQNFSMNHSLSLTATHQQNNSDGDVEMTDAEIKQAQAEVKSKEEKSKIETATLHIPAEIGSSIVINLDDELSVLSFRENIDEQSKTGDSTIFARILTQDENGKFHTTFREAHDFHQFLFGPYPYNLTLAQMSLKQENGFPLCNDQRTPIYDVQYYIYNPKQSADGFQFFCSFQQFAALDQSKGHWRTKFYANQNSNINLKQESLIQLAIIGQKFVKQGNTHKLLQPFPWDSFMTPLIKIMTRLMHVIVSLLSNQTVHPFS